MKFHAILLTRDAEDIIEENLTAALSWADYIYVQDTGSLDSTLHKVRSLSIEDPRIVVLPSRVIGVFHEGLRADIFNTVRSRAREGDWFVHLDEDEFYHDDPRQFIQELGGHETAIWSQLYEFRLTRTEMKRLRLDGELERDRAKPIIDRRRHYEVLDYSEARLFKYRTTMIWTRGNAFPYNAGYVARRRIAIRHYPHRDHVQLTSRLNLRHEMLKNLQPGTYPHWHLTLDQLIVDENAAGLRHWVHGQDLPVSHRLNHLAPVHKRFAQRLLHRCAVRAVDQMRAVYFKMTTQET